MSFYVTLPSDSSAGYFPENTLSKYITYLPEIIKFNGDYEVGLAEFSYPRTWYNVKMDSPIRDWHTAEPGDNSVIYEKIIIVPPGFYATPSDLIEMIMCDSDNIVEFKYNSIAKRVTIDSKERANVDIPVNIALMLGLTLDSSKKTIRISEPTKAPYIADMDVGLHTLYVYSDVVALNTLGNTSVNILRLISVKGKEGETVDVVFAKPHYSPVSSPQLRTIEINVMDDTGKPVQFQRGKVHATLHFRPRRSWAVL